MRTLVVGHPLVAEQLSVLRDKQTGIHQFRSSLRSASALLVYEATRDLKTVTYVLETPLSPTHGIKVSDPPLIVPILRAGLGMLDAATSLLNDSEVAFVGISKDGYGARRECYLSTLPRDLSGRAVLVLDPMLATGYTAAYVCDELVTRNASEIILISLLAASAGIEYLESREYAGKIITAAVDLELNDIAFIVPGLGDAGDRQFGEW